MVMKTYKSIFILAAVLFLGSCKDDFIRIEPESSISANQYFKTQEEATLAVNGAYAPLQTIASSQWWILSELRSDNTTYQYNEGDRRNLPIEQVDDFLVQPNNPITEGFWAASYRGISRCNVFLNRVNDVPFTDEKLKSRLTGEILFLRAFYYYNLTRMFGAVPLVTQEVTAPDNDEQYVLAKSSLEEIYPQLIAYLEEAASLMTDGNYSTKDKGRATPGAAYMLLGEIHMVQKQFDLANRAFAKVEEMGYNLLDDYASVFDPGNKNHAESIFEVQYFESNQGKGSNFIYRFAPFNSGQEIVGDNQLIPYNAGFNIPTHDLIATYEDGDKRKEASIAWYTKDGNDGFDVSVGNAIPFINKYNHGHSVPGVTNDNFPVFRYSRTLLLQAEALNELNRTAEANAYVSRVRKRAGLAVLPASLSQDAFREAVYHELQVELAFENWRWSDLLRTDQALQAMREHGENRKKDVPRLGNAYEVMPYKLWYPIPVRELKLNSKLVQNEGW